MFQRFILGAAFGAVITAASGFIATSLGATTVNGIVLSLFVGIVAGLASVIGGAK